VAAKEEDFLSEIRSVVRTGDQVFISWFLEFIRVLHPRWGTPMAPTIYNVFAQILTHGNITAQHVFAAMALPKSYKMVQATHPLRNMGSAVGMPFRCATFGREALFGYLLDPIVPMRIHLPGLALEQRNFELLSHMIKIERTTISKENYGPAMRAILSCGHFICDGRIGDIYLGSQNHKDTAHAFLCQLVEMCTDVLAAGEPIDDAFVETIRFQRYLFVPGSFSDRPVPRRVFGSLRNAVQELLLRLQNYRDLRPPSERLPRVVLERLDHVAAQNLARLEREQLEEVTDLEADSEPPEHFPMELEKTQIEQSQEVLDTFLMWIEVVAINLF
jgi:hypothetical protein